MERGSSVRGRDARAHVETDSAQKLTCILALCSMTDGCAGESGADDDAGTPMPVLLESFSMLLPCCLLSPLTWCLLIIVLECFQHQTICKLLRSVMITADAFISCSACTTQTSSKDGNAIIINGFTLRRHR